MRVAFISMPFAPLDLPLISLGLFKQILSDQKIDCSLHYFQKLFLKYCNRLNYEFIADTAQTGLGICPLLEIGI